MAYPLLSSSAIFRRLNTDKGRKVDLLVPAQEKEADLNEAAEQVVIRCDGTKTVLEIAQELSLIFDKTPVDTIVARINEILDPLIESGFISVEEKPLDTPRAMPPTTSVSRVLQSLVFEATYACNQKCVHCYVGAGAEEKEIINLGQISNMIDQFAQAGGTSLILTGGEALLRRDILEIIAYAAQKPLSVTLLSNGTLVTPTLARQLKEAGLAIVQLSLDGHCAEIHDAYRGMPGAFERTIAAVGFLQEADLEVELGTVLHRQNIEHIVEIINLGKSFGITPTFAMQKAAGRALTTGQTYQISYQESAQALVQIDKLLSDENSNRFLVKRLPEKGHRCSAGVSSLTVRPNGDIVPCMDFHDAFWVLGNVTRDTLLEVWESDHPALVQLRTSHPEDIKFCDACKHHEYCAGGCPADALKTWGDLNWPDLEKCSYFALADPYLEIRESTQ